jgi:hypothetical protein
VAWVPPQAKVLLIFEVPEGAKPRRLTVGYRYFEGWDEKTPVKYQSWEESTAVKKEDKVWRDQD